MLTLVRMGTFATTRWLVAELNSTSLPGHVFAVAALAAADEGVHFLLVCLFGCLTLVSMPGMGFAMRETRPCISSSILFGSLFSSYSVCSTSTHAQACSVPLWPKLRGAFPRGSCTWKQALQSSTLSSHHTAGH